MKDNCRPPIPHYPPCNCEPDFPKFCPPPAPPVPCMPPVPSVVEGQSLYEAVNNLSDRVNVCISTYNNVMANCYETLRNLERAAEENGAYYGPCEVWTEEGYLADESSTYTLIHKAVVDRCGEPIRLNLHLAYGNTTNSKVSQNLFSASKITYADKIVVAQPMTENGWYGNAIWNGCPITSDSQPTLYTVGFTKAGAMRVYSNGASINQMLRDTIENAMGCSGVLIQNGQLTENSWLENIPNYDQQVSRVCMGQNSNTREVIFLVCGNENDVNKKGMTSKACAKILLEYGCDIAVELSEGASAGAMDKGSLMFVPDNDTVPDAYCFWYISRKCFYKNDYERELAELMQNYGKSIWGTYLNYKNIENLRNELNEEIQNREEGDANLQTQITNEVNDRINADKALQNNIDQEAQTRAEEDAKLEAADEKLQASITDLETRVTKCETDISTLQTLYNELQKQTASMDEAITAVQQTITAIEGSLNNIKTTIEEIRATFVKKSGDTMSGPLNMGNNRILSLAEPIEDTDAATKLYVDTHSGGGGEGGLTPEQADKRYLQLTGGTLTGDLNAPALNSTMDTRNARFRGNGVTLTNSDSNVSYTNYAGNITSNGLDGFNIYSQDKNNNSINIVGEASTGIITTTTNIGGTPSNPIVRGVSTPEQNIDVANKKYVDDQISSKGGISQAQGDARYLRLDGGKMTGDINMSGNRTVTNLNAPANATDAATKQYVDNANSLKVSKTGDTMTGQLQVNASIKAQSPYYYSSLTSDGLFVQSNSSGKDYTSVIHVGSGGNVEGGRYMGYKASTSQFASVGFNTSDPRFPLVTLTRNGTDPVVLTGVATPTDSNDAANKAYVDANKGITQTAADNRYLQLSGGTLSGDVTSTRTFSALGFKTNERDGFRVFARGYNLGIESSTDPSNYVSFNPTSDSNNKINGFSLSVSDGTGADTGSFSFMANSFILGLGNTYQPVKLTGIATPTLNTDAVNKQYVDTGLVQKISLTAATLKSVYKNGTSIFVSAALSYIGFNVYKANEAYILKGRAEITIAPTAFTKGDVINGIITVPNFAQVVGTNWFACMGNNLIGNSFNSGTDLYFRVQAMENISSTNTINLMW